MITSLKRWVSLFALILVAASAQAQSGKLDAAYLCGHDGTCTYSTLVAERYELVVTSECGAWHDQLKADNPNVITFVYTSGSDNYTYPHSPDYGWYYGSREHAWLKQRCQELGYSPEILYVHYYENTEVSDHSIPGTYSSTVTDADSVSRVPVYLSHYQGNGIGRILVNFSHPITRQLQIEYAKKAWTDPNAGDDWPESSYWDGYYLDNWIANEIHPGMGQIGNLTSGGRLAEHPTHGVIGTTETVEWYQQQMNMYARQLRDTLHNGAAWSPDGKPKYLAANIANTWIWDFADPAIGGLDYLLHEFQYNPIRCRDYVVPQAYSRDSACYANGIYNLYCSLQTMTPSTGDGEVTQSEALYDNLAWYYITRSPNTYMYQYHQSPSTYWVSDPPDSWDSLTWRGCMEFDVGMSQGHYSILQTGTDPVGYEYEICQREYSKALVLLRARGGWNEDITPQTAVAVSLPTAYREVQVDGSLGPLSTTFTLRNGRGLILAKPDAGQSDIVAPSPLDPTHGEVIQNQQPRLTAKNADDPESRSLLYQFQLDAEGDFGGVDLIESSPGDISSLSDTTTAWDMPQQLADGSSYYWRSRVVTTSGEADTSDWSWAFQFSISMPSSNNCPTPPNPVSPAHGAQTEDITPSLEVQNSYDADGDPLTYGFVVCSNSAMTNVVASTSGRSEGSGSTAWTVSPHMSGGQTYYWYARAYDGQCYSAWSVVRSFTITVGTNDPPPIPSGEAPIDGDTITSAALQLTVENVEDPEGDQVWYQFLIKLDGNTIDIKDGIEEGSGSTTAWTPDVAIPKNQELTWRAQTRDYTSYSGWSTHYSFYLKNLTPPQPVPHSPLNDDTLLSQNVVLSLNNVTDPDGEEVTYEFQVFADAELTNLVAQISGISEGSSRTSWLASFTPQNGETYYWRGRTEDLTEAGPWSDTQMFVTSWLVVDVEGRIPQLISPANGIRVNELRPQFQLRLPPEAMGEKCELEIASDLNFTEQRVYSGELDVESNIVTWSPADEFTPGVTYYWRARLVGGDWSMVAAFTVETDIHFAPNPYILTDGASVTIYNLPPGSEVRLYTVAGKLVVTLTNENEPELRWDVTNDHGESLAPGVYMYTVHSSLAPVKGKFVVSP